MWWHRAATSWSSRAAETVLQIWTVCVYLNHCMIVWHLITNLTLNQWAIKNKTQITYFPRRNKIIWVVAGVHEVLLVGRRVDRKITLPAGVSKSRTSPDVSFFFLHFLTAVFSLSVRKKNKNKQRSVKKPTLLWTLIFSVETVSKSVSPAPLRLLWSVMNHFKVRETEFLWNYVNQCWLCRRALVVCFCYVLILLHIFSVSFGEKLLSGAVRQVSAHWADMHHGYVVSRFVWC